MPRMDMSFHYLFSRNFFWVIITHTQSQQWPSQYTSLQNNYSFSENNLPSLHLCCQFEFPFQINSNIFSLFSLPFTLPFTNPKSQNLRASREHFFLLLQIFPRILLKKFHQWLLRKQSHSNHLSPPRITSSLS